MDACIEDLIKNWEIWKEESSDFLSEATIREEFDVFLCFTLAFSSKNSDQPTEVLHYFLSTIAKMQERLIQDEQDNPI